MAVGKRTAEALEQAQRISQEPEQYDVRIYVMIKPGQMPQVVRSERRRRMLVSESWDYLAEFKNGVRYK